MDGDGHIYVAQASPRALRAIHRDGRCDACDSVSRSESCERLQQHLKPVAAGPDGNIYTADASATSHRAVFNRWRTGNDAAIATAKRILGQR